MNNGRDSFFYLQKGFRVVAVEANPVMARRCSRDLSEYIGSGQLVIENVGLGDTQGTFPFYVNLDNDHWSSFDRGWATRAGTRYEVIEVPCITPLELFNKYGIPYYLKVDIEGHDLMVVRALSRMASRPKYVSVEEGGAYFFAELWSIGCRHFKIVNQNDNTQVKLPTPFLEGSRYVDQSFDGTTSGPFGDEAPGKWLSFDEAVEFYLTRVRSPTHGWVGPEGSWFDIHGRTETKS